MARCLEPLVGPDARVLILGSVPGEQSIAQQRYYAHGRNAFWPLMETLLGDGSVLRYEERLSLVTDAGIALWDVLASAERAGSLDSAIAVGSEAPNDLTSFLQSHPRIAHVFFNGQKAHQAFERHFGNRSELDHLEFGRLPSTSPANAAMSFQAKLEAWRAVVPPAREQLTNACSASLKELG